MGIRVGGFRYHKGLEVGMNVAFVYGREKPYLAVNF